MAHRAPRPWAGFPTVGSPHHNWGKIWPQGVPDRRNEDIQAPPRRQVMKQLALPAMARWVCHFHRFRRSWHQASRVFHSLYTERRSSWYLHRNLPNRLYLAYKFTHSFYASEPPRLILPRQARSPSGRPTFPARVPPYGCTPIQDPALRCHISLP